MTVMHAEVFEALRSIGAPEDKAVKAAVLLSSAFANARGSRTIDPFSLRSDRENMFEAGVDIEAIHRDMAGFKSELALHRWMMSIVLAMVTALLIHAFTH